MQPLYSDCLRTVRGGRPMGMSRRITDGLLKDANATLFFLPVTIDHRRTAFPDPL